MEDSKRAAKAFVDQYFPVNDPKPNSTDVFEDLFPSNSKKVRDHDLLSSQVSPKKQGHGVQGWSARMATADCKHQGDSNKSQITPQESGNDAEHSEVSEPCLMSSSVDYGCRDNYPYNPDNRYPGPSYYVEKKDRKDGSEYANIEVAGGAEWWQGSLYY
ncbi:uncharacterized protein LOC109849938 isoform X2 [Asparagus officinalis]|uniref:uncharacterized protein LOC109849938 isoform X2 n=1 Tax=Asparagus officinalis TaxID=4686 RepID=UPI00098E6A85|nr:uncharacterized protein LOC109849938 isoform X2 [Asparagus officinalis]